MRAAFGGRPRLTGAPRAHSSTSSSSSNWSCPKSRQRSREVRTSRVAGCSPPTDAEEFSNFGESGQAECHVGTLRRPPDRTVACGAKVAMIRPLNEQSTPMTAPSPTHEDSCRAFVGYLGRQGRAPGTQLKYGLALAAFGAWLDGRNAAALASDEIDEYLESWQATFVLRNGRSPSSATYRAQVSALRAFYAWLERFDHLRDVDGRAVPDPMRRITAPPVEQRANDWLRPHEDTALLGVECNAQERIILQLLRWSGLRVGEATSLVVADIDLTPGEESLVVRHSKTPAGRRTIPIVPALDTHVARGSTSWRRKDSRPAHPCCARATARRSRRATCGASSSG